MKKILSLVLALAMLMSCMSALAEGAFTPADSYDVGERAYNAGVVEVSMAEGGSGNTVDTVAFAGEAGKDYTDEKVYTYNDYIGGTTSMDWNPHTWETSDDSMFLDFINMGFYSFYLNEEGDGYSVLPEMAADYPVDVTSEYVGQLGVEEGESAKAWRIALNQDATWENGEKITADDYIYSMQQQLNPKMLNRRADSYYAGDLQIVGARNYLYSGATVYDLITDTAENLIAAGTDVYVDIWGFWGMEGTTDDEGNPCPHYVLTTDEVMYRDPAVEDPEGDEAYVSGKYLFENYFAAGQVYEAYQSSYMYTATVADETTWDEVGLKKIDEYTIDLILVNPMEEASFYLPYNLSSNWLVYQPLYEECKSFFDADGKQVATEEEAATVTTDYCRSLEKTIGYGPYKLTYFELDKQITFERNDEWYGYRDGKHTGMFQMDRYNVTVIPDHATVMMAFLNGEIDGASLQDADMETYASSAYIHYTPQSYTTKLTWNTDYEKLLSRGTNSQIQVIDEFRKGFAFALDRNAFATSFTAAGTAGFGMLNYLYTYDPFTGATYRSSDYAKKALVNTFEVPYGEGEAFETLDEAYEALTGYDIEKARELMQAAYEKAVASGIYDGESDIVLDLRVYNSDTIYVQMFTYLDTQLKEACVGTGFEGKVSMNMTADADYYNTNYSGGADMIFTTWGGAAMAPFGVLSNCYTDGSDGSGNQMEYGYDTSAIALTINMNGTDYTYSLQDWANWMNAYDVTNIISDLGKFADYSYDTRCGIMAACETAFLHWFPTTSIYYRNVASLYSQKVNYATDTYNNIMGYGGLTHMTFNYDDAEWAAYVAEQGGTLTY
ncbi:MAG: hypothetical protein J1E43_03000 [Christensenellaceae bacterium]|nr:hypothetical protein [Christensenellaceae bacterium]